MGEINIQIRVKDKGYSEAVVIKNQVVSLLSTKPDWDLIGMSFSEDMNS